MEIIEQKFRQMGLPITDENNDEKKEDDEIRFGSFEDLNKHKEALRQLVEWKH